MEGWLAWAGGKADTRYPEDGLFDNYQLYRLLEQDEEEGPTFVVQFFTSNPERYERFLIQFAPANATRRAGQVGK